MKIDALVIGGGVIGVTTLHELCARGVQAVLVESLDDLALGTSFANGGLLTPSMSDPWNGPGVGAHLLASFFDPGSAMKLSLSRTPDLALWGLEFLRNATADRHQASTLANFRLAQYSLVETRTLVERLDIRMDDNDRGSLKLFQDAASIAGPLAIARRLAKDGLQARVLDAAEAVALEPCLAAVADRIHGAIHYPRDGVGDARAFTRQLAAAARQAGARILSGVRVERLRKMEGGGFQVLTQGEPLFADRVIVAAGSATPRLLKPLGLRLPVKPAKGYSLTLDMTGLSETPAVAVVDDALHAAVTPLGDRLRVAGMAEFAGEDLRLDPRRIDRLWAMFRSLYPRLVAQVNPASAEPWTGLRPMSADGRPFIGQTRIPGLWVNAGHGHLGWTLAVGSAKILVHQMLDPNVELGPSAFALTGRTV